MVRVTVGVRVTLGVGVRVRVGIIFTCLERKCLQHNRIPLVSKSLQHARESGCIGGAWAHCLVALYDHQVIHIHGLARNWARTSGNDVFLNHGALVEVTCES